MTAQTGAPVARPALVPPGERGATRVADRVVAKIASQAAREALGERPRQAEPPYATVVVHHDAARVRVHLELGWPEDIGTRCAAVRRRVAERVGTLAGLEVPEVAVHVERLHPLPEPSPEPSPETPPATPADGAGTGGSAPDTGTGAGEDADAGTARERQGGQGGQGGTP